jgi:4-amino-4-deoxy-L-arabinose transferase-like glycosyltransferase
MKRAAWVGPILAVAYVALLLSTSRELGMGRDEAFYVDAGERYAEWYSLLFRDPHEAIQPESVDRFWSTNHEHPSLPKSLFAWSWMLQRSHHIFPVDSMAFRFPAMVLAGALVWLVYAFGARVYGARAGLFAALAWALVPNVFYHSHLDCFDVPIVTMLTLVTYCYWRSLTRPRWAIATGIAYGLALETKHNAWILPILLSVHWFAFVLPTELSARKSGQARVASWFPWWLLGMGTLGPLLFVGLWPWLWHDTQARFSEYAAFHLQHIHYNTAFLGTTYFGPPSPSSFPWVMTAFLVPTTTLALAILGILLRSPALFPRPWAAHLWPERRPRPDRRATDALLFGSMITPMLALMLPSTPIFGGAKHFMGGWVYLAMFAGVGADRVCFEVAKRAPGIGAKWERLLAPTALATLILPSAVETWHSHPFGLSHYGYLAGGVPGAADLGMMRQFWGFTTGSLAPWLDEHVAPNGSVWICDTLPTAFRMLQRDGRLRDDVRVAYDLGSADFALVHHEDHFAEVEYQIWAAYGRVDPVYVLTYDGVPIISVYENPHRRR